MAAPGMGEAAKMGMAQVYTASPPTRSQLLRAARDCGRRDRRVFTLRPASKVPYGGTRGHLDATTDAGRITAMFNARPRSNIGIATGNGLMVLDFDPDRGGAGSLDALENQHGELPPTYAVETPSGGFHLYFEVPPGVEVRNSSDKLGPGLDVRGDGGYVVAPPSVTTKPYTVLEDRPVAPAPDWLLRATRGPERAVRGSQRAVGDPRGPVPLDGVGPIPEGRRDVTLTRIAGHLHDGSRSLDELTAELLEINEARCEPPLPPRQVGKIAASIYRREPCRKATPEITPETVEALDRIEGELWRREWHGMAGKSDRDVFVALIKLAREYGTLTPSGVRVSVAFRELAPLAAVSKPTGIKAIRRLKDAGLIRADNGHRKAREAGAFVLLTPRATLYCTHPRRLAMERGSSVCGKDLRGPLSAARLRWGSPEIKRLGKGCGAVLDALEAHGGTATLDALADTLTGDDGKRPRPRDIRRRYVARLEAAAVVECSGDTVALLCDWYEALEVERERAGEIAAENRDRARYEREREAYGNRHKVKPEPVPEITHDVRGLRRIPDLFGKIGQRVETPDGPGVLWDHKAGEARVVLDVDTSRWVPIDVADIELLEAV